MNFAECVFTAVNDPQKGCCIKKMYPKTVYNQLNQPLSKFLFPKGVDMKNAYVRFFVGKKTENNITKIDNVSKQYEAIVSSRSNKTGSILEISNKIKVSIVCYLYNDHIHLAILDSKNPMEIEWSEKIEDSLCWRMDAFSNKCFINITPHDVLTLQFADRTALRHFVDEYETLRVRLVEVKKTHPPSGNIALFSRLYYGCGVVFSVGGLQAMMGVISPSIYAFSSMEMFLLRILNEENTNMVQRLYQLLNSCGLPVSISPMIALQSSLNQLYFQYAHLPRYTNEPRLNREYYRKTLSCEWVPRKRVPFEYYTLITENFLPFSLDATFLALLKGLDNLLFLLIDSILCEKRVVLFSSKHSINQMQEMLLLVGSMVKELIPSIFAHVLLLADLDSLTHLLAETPTLWFITWSNDPSLFRYSQLYDVCFDMDSCKLYATETTAKQFQFPLELNRNDQRMMNHWMNEYSRLQNFYGLFQHIQQYVHILGLLLFTEDFAEMLVQNPEYAVLEARAHMLKNASSFAYLKRLYAETREKLPSIYRNVDLLAFAPALSEKEIEDIFGNLEICTRESMNVYHLLLALFLCDKEATFILRGLYAKSNTVKKHALRIFARIEQNETTNLFTDCISFVDAQTRESMKTSLY